MGDAASGRPAQMTRAGIVRAAAYAPPIAPHPRNADIQKAYNGAVAKWLGSPAEPTNTLTAQQALQEAQTEVQRVLDDWNKANPR